MIKELMKALEVGSYGAAPGQLVGGGPLQVEDLDVTLKLVTFDCPIWTTSKQFSRLLRRLNDRQIFYTLTTRRKAHIMAWNRKLVVGDRELFFLDTEAV